jgi:hypothetical protein
LENLKAGKYFIALKDLNNNNKFDLKKEKIGFIKHFITINDTVYELELFKETPFKAFKPNQASGNLLMSYEGNMKLAESRPK